jgi:hypothetical protein
MTASVENSMALLETSSGTKPADSVSALVSPLVACGGARHERTDALTNVPGTLVKLKRHREYCIDALRDEK